MHTCHNCGAFVTSDFSRVFGDNDDVVHVCMNCATLPEVRVQEFVENPGATPL